MEEKEFLKKASEWNNQNANTSWLLVKRGFYKFLKVYLIMTIFLFISSIILFAILISNGSFNDLISSSINNSYNFTNLNEYNPTTNNQYSNDFDNYNSINNTYEINLEISDDLIEKICNSS